MNLASRETESSSLPAPRKVPRLPVLDLDAPAVAVDAASNAIPALLDQRACLLTTSGRAAILHGLKALGVGAGDAVLVPTYHCPTMVAPIVHLGARPAFYALAADGTPDMQRLDAANAGAKAMLVVHFFGFPQRLDRLADWCRQRGIALVEDCAHAFFGAADGAAVGTAGDVAIGSLSKFFPVPAGGCLVGRPALLDTIALAPTGAIEELRGLIDLGEAAAEHSRLGALNAAGRLAIDAKRWLRRPRPGAGAATARGGQAEAMTAHLDPVACNRRPAWVVRRAVQPPIDRSQIVLRRRNYQRLAQRFAGVSGLRPLRPDLPAGAVPYVFPLHVETPDPAYSSMRALGVPVFRWDSLWPGTPALAGDVGPLWARHVLQLGCHQGLRPDELEWIADAVIELVACAGRAGSNE